MCNLRRTVRARPASLLGSVEAAWTAMSVDPDVHRKREIQMMTEQSSAERNVEVVKGVFDAVARGDQAAAQAPYDENFVIEFNWGHPASGAFQGDKIYEGRMTMITLLGLTDVQLRTVIADGPSRVVVLADGKGTDAGGEPWSIPAVQLYTFENGKIIRVSHMFTGHARLLEIARGREGEAAAPLGWPGVGVRDLTSND